MRLPYIDDDTGMATAENQAMVHEIKERRGGKLIALDKALLHAPPIASGWNAFFGAIRTQTTLADSLRELIMCRIAVLNSAFYEWEQHKPLLERAGFTADMLEKLRDREWDGAGLDDKHLAVFQYTTAMTVGCAVHDPLFERVRDLFNEREIVEITTTSAGYNAVSRLLVALDVGEMAAKYNLDFS